MKLLIGIAKLYGSYLYLDNAAPLIHFFWEYLDWAGGWVYLLGMLCIPFIFHSGVCNVLYPKSKLQRVYSSGGKSTPNRYDAIQSVIDYRNCLTETMSRASSQDLYIRSNISINNIKSNKRMADYVNCKLQQKSRENGLKYLLGEDE